MSYWNGAGASGVRAPVTLRALSPYSFTRGGWHFVALPDACFRVSGCDADAITTWLRNDLAANPTPCTVAYFHQAYFTSATSGHDSFDAVAPWVKVLVDHRVDVLLQGHNHDYERFAPQNEARGADPNGIQAFVVGTGGIGFYSFRGSAPNSVTRQNDTFGVLELSLGNGSYSWNFARAAGGSYADRGSMACRYARAAAEARCQHRNGASRSEKEHPPPRRSLGATPLVCHLRDPAPAILEAGDLGVGRDPAHLGPHRAQRRAAGQTVARNRR